MNLLNSVISDTEAAQAQQAKKSAEKAITQVTTKIHKAAKSGKTSCKVLRRCAGNLDRNHRLKRNYLKNEGFTIVNTQTGFEVSW